jgi:hypothetical protein
MNQDFFILEKTLNFRKLCYIFEKSWSDVLLVSCFGGGIGTFFYLKEPIWGFVLFSWGIILIYVLLVLYIGFFFIDTK